MSWFDGVVVITSASHAEGREFKPRSNLFLAHILVRDDFLHTTRCFCVSNHIQISSVCFCFFYIKRMLDCLPENTCTIYEEEQQVYFVVAG